MQIAQPASTSFSVSTLWHSGAQRGMHIGSCENIAVQAGTNRNTLPQNEGLFDLGSFTVFIGLVPAFFAADMCLFVSALARVYVQTTVIANWFVVAEHIFSYPLDRVFLPRFIVYRFTNQTSDSSSCAACPWQRLQTKPLGAHRSDDSQINPQAST